MYRVARKIKALTVEDQINNLRKRVYLQHPDFRYQEGMLISIEVNKKYWVYLDMAYQTKDGKYSRKKEFHKDDIRLLNYE